MVISWWGALIGLALAIYLILKKLNPVYSLMLGAIIGALLGGASLTGTIDILVKGEQSVMGTVLRVLAAGMLAGVMMESGAAETLARTIVDKLGDRMAILSLALATMVITAVGVFIPVAVLIVAPIALEVGRRMHISKLALLVALSGGGKAGNIISPNANTIAAAKVFGLELSQVMIANFIPAVVALIVTVIVARLLVKKGDAVMEADLGDMVDSDTGNLPTLGQAVVTPILAIVLLLLNPIGQVAHLTLLTKVNLDATYVLPFAAIVGALVMKKGRELRDYARVGMTRMTDVVLILIGAGAIGATITSSNLPQLLIKGVEASHMPGVLLAPISGILMAAATASTSTGVILATGSFAKAILGFGVAPLAAAAMVHTGAIVIDQLPQGNYFHVTANAMHMDLRQRSQGILYEAMVGGSAMLTATILYGFLHLI
ncbi:Na+/H+ antiporter NhaC family protein [Limosilactobacillus fermentum]|uniref:GntP family permease n=1 Tax=Limosilactobacillus fermentum TaxID=1613 RepID=UPI00097315DC|nr:SLC13 family permease [Limosilactobacillus fermentum]MBM9560224.1 GntP family permease [Limosilactobacillus fermentum]MPW03272.1 GntP family permease [Limosilactobacillus fermentum]WJD85334.1 Na+/H+ antiporter NhaC family protein [Limosilactobacillus fermentum]BAW86231.1 gluconate:proton symporter [Limosilactobacillus fermentum]